uniref:Pancreatic trypsin inhibitor n=1 Tax=Rhipicephalus appendiculatus TaxID=34631 RepID=A0A131YPF0_RHIAP
MLKVQAGFVAVLMTAVPLCGTAPAANTSLQSRLHRRECSEPLMEEVRFCGNLRIWRYFYNHTSQQCQQFMWDNCLIDGVHMTRIDCAKKCNLNEQPGICSEDPAGTCARYAATSNYYPKKSFFYNITSKRCEEYQVCMSLGYILHQNSFASKTLCIMHCRGFGRRGIAKKELLGE